MEEDVKCSSRIRKVTSFYKISELNILQKNSNECDLIEN